LSLFEERNAKTGRSAEKTARRYPVFSFFTQNIDELLTKVRELSLEALIGKPAGSKYDSKRSRAWIKIKLYQQVHS
jgi:ATP-dependent DNA ligase